MRQHLDDTRRAELGRAFAASRAEHMGDRPGQVVREELQQQTRNAGVSRASTMSTEHSARRWTSPT